MATTIPNTVEASETIRWAFCALYSNTTYAVGTFGSSLDFEKNLKKITKSGWNAEHKEQIYADAKKGFCFAFDCIGFVKSTGWWGWEGDPDMIYGGAAYKSNKMSDISVHAFFRDLCYSHKKITAGVNVPIGTYCGLNDWSHIAIAAGNNTVIEATRYGTHNVRRARIKGLKTLPEFEKLPEREFDFYAFCKYVTYDDVYVMHDAAGHESLIRKALIHGCEDVNDITLYPPITLELQKVQK